MCPVLPSFCSCGDKVRFSQGEANLMSVWLLAPLMLKCSSNKLIFKLFQSHPLHYQMAHAEFQHLVLLRRASNSCTHTHRAAAWRASGWRLDLLSSSFSPALLDHSLSVCRCVCPVWLTVLARIQLHEPNPPLSFPLPLFFTVTFSVSLLLFLSVLVSLGEFHRSLVVGDPTPVAVVTVFATFR